MSSSAGTEQGRAAVLEIIASAKPFPPLAEVWPQFAETPPRAPRKRAALAKTTLKDGSDDKGNTTRGAPKGRKRTPQRDSLLGLVAEKNVELWHNPDGDGYATFPVKDHREHRAIRSGREFRQWLSLIYLEATGGTLGGQAMEDALRVLDARAVHHGPEYPTWRRVGKLGEGLYLDLCDAKWRAIEITAGGWRIVATPPVKFLRSAAMRALPEPEAGDCIERLGSFMNLATGEDLILVTAWLVAALRVGVPFPILVLSGEQGSGKSVAAKLLRSLIDPNDAPVRSTPRDDRDLIVAAVNTHVLAFDNLSGVAHWFADGLSRIATGSGYSTRRLHTDADEMVFSAAKPCILNGIPALTDRADMADRALAIHLPTISEAERRPEAEYWRDFEIAAPGILGALLDGVSAALRNLPTTRLTRLPRMADFAAWVIAAEPGLGWEADTFITAYERNRQVIFEEAAEADPIVLLIRERWDRLTQCREDGGSGVWEGRPTDLLQDLNSLADEGIRKSRSWPSTPSALGTRIKRAAPTLRRCGFLVESRRSVSRTIRIVRNGL